MNLLNIKKVITLTVSIILLFSQSELAVFSQDLSEIDSANLIFPNVPNRLIPDFKSLKERPKNIIFKNSAFGFIFPKDSKSNEALISSPNAVLKVKIKDSQNQEFELESEVLIFNKSKPIETLPNLFQSSSVRIVNIEALPSGISEGNATLSLLIDDSLTETDDVFISKTISEKLELDDISDTKVNSVSVINRPIKGTNTRLIKIFVGGQNFYGKKIGTSLKASARLTKATLFPRDAFFGFSSKILKGREVLITSAKFVNPKANGEALLFVITPSGIFTEKINIPLCTKACGEN